MCQLESPKMFRFATLLLFICLSAGLTHGMECSFGHKNFIQRIVDSCPGLLDSSDKSYCCLNFEGDTYCCDLLEFTWKSYWFILVSISVIVCIVFMIACCVSCLCCACCPWYRRRHQGTTYGQVQVPSNVVHVVLSPANVPEPTQLYSATSQSYPTNSTDTSPPPYTNELYEKQAPYNPNYVH